MKFHLGFFVMGAVFLLGGILILINELKKRKNNTATVKAEVFMYFTQVDSDADTGSETVTHHPIMRYCVSGQWYEQRSETGWNKQKYSIGEQVDILYDPKHPEKFSFPGENTSLIASIVGIVLGVAGCILAFVL